MGRVNPKALLTPTNPHDIKEMPGLASSETPAWVLGFLKADSAVEKLQGSQFLREKPISVCTQRCHGLVQKLKVSKDPPGPSVFLTYPAAQFTSALRWLHSRQPSRLPSQTPATRVAQPHPPEDASGNLSPPQAPLALDIDIPLATALSR